MKILLSTAYFAPIQYYTKIYAADKIFLEQFENFPKQTYRNRCEIFSANGILSLTVPVSKGELLKIHTKDIRIDYSTNWQKIHYKAIESAYRCSPFYEYYIDELESFFNQKFDFLIDFNTEILVKTCEIIGISIDLEPTKEFNEIISGEIMDIRFSIHPKKHRNLPDIDFIPPVYRQVFEPKLGFIGNLSILDLLFNTGPNCINLLK